jgi:hypothetical protein
MLGYVCVNVNVVNRTTWYGIMRQHFVHACFSSVLSALAIAELCPVEVAIHCSLGYFGVDMVNMLLNDLIFPIPSYQCVHTHCFRAATPYTCTGSP